MSSTASEGTGKNDPIESVERAFGNVWTRAMDNDTAVAHTLAHTRPTVDGIQCVTKLKKGQ